QLRKPFLRANIQYLQDQLPYIIRLYVDGPSNAGDGEDTPSRKRIFVCHPSTAAEEASCASSILTTLARRAYRRPVSAADVHQLVSFYDAERERGGDFESG